MKRKFILRLILVFVLVIIIWGFSTVWPKENLPKNNGKMLVITSVYPLEYFAGEIGGEKVMVENITPAGVEPHDYEPTARDMIRIQQARLLVLNGGKFETWGEKIKDEFKDSNMRMVEAGQGLFVGGDPHVWISPDLAKIQAQAILTGMMRQDPANAGLYLKNGKILNEKLTKLQMDYTTGLTDCRKKEFIASHDAFGYLAKEFGLTQIAIAGLTPDAEPSTKQLTDITKIAEEKRIKYIFFEKLVNPKLSETIAAEIGAKTLVLDPIEGISDNDRRQGKNYLSIMEDNLSNLRIALECR